VLAAIRPEKFSLSRVPQAQAVQAQLVAIAYLGDRDQFRLMVSASKTPVTVSAQNLGGQDGGFRIGDTVYLSWSPDAVVILGAD